MLVIVGVGLWYWAVVYFHPVAESKDFGQFEAWDLSEACFGRNLVSVCLAYTKIIVKFKKSFKLTVEAANPWSSHPSALPYS